MYLRILSDRSNDSYTASEDKLKTILNLRSDHEYLDLKKIDDLQPPFQTQSKSHGNSLETNAADRGCSAAIDYPLNGGTASAGRIGRRITQADRSAISRFASNTRRALVSFSLAHGNNGFLARDTSDTPRRPRRIDLAIDRARLSVEKLFAT